MAVGFESLSNGFDAAGVFGIEFAVGFESSPIRCDVFGALVLLFGRCMRSNPREDAGGNGAGGGCLVIACQQRANFVDGDQLAAPNLPHNAVDLGRSRNDEGAFAPFGDHPA